MSSINLLTPEEALNARTISSGAWDVQPMKSWFDKDPSDTATTGHLDVSDTTLISVQCGDPMCISFDNPLANILEDPNFDTDTAASTTGTYWTTGAGWVISGGKATYSGSTYQFLKQLVSLPANHNALLEYDIGFEEGGPLVPCVDGWIHEESVWLNEGGVGSVFLQDGEDSSMGLRIYAGSQPTRWNGSINYLRLLPVPQINKSTAFVLHPGQYQLQVPQGLGDRIIFSYLPYREPTDKQRLYMRIVRH